MTSKALKVKGNFNRLAKRVSGSKPERPAPYSLRLSDAERQYLKNKAGDMSLHGYIRTRIFDDDAPIPSTRKQPRVSDMQALSKVLGKLGRSNISNNLNQIAIAIHDGSLNLSDDILDELHTACAEIATMRSQLIKALGLKENKS